MILAAKRVYVFGFGNSATVCTDMETRFCAWVWPSEPMPIPICRLPKRPSDA